jgi:nucleoside-diphosphate-sugar epimerase
MLPLNAYGRSKAAGEQLIDAARRDGLRACTVRLSNVFGAVSDYPDRVVPAFARAAAAGHELRVDGAERVFDFTHVDDVARGIAGLAELLHASDSDVPTVQLVSGIPVTLGDLARLAMQVAGTNASLRYTTARSFDVASFVGNGDRAKAVLGWSPTVDLREGLARLIRAFQHRSVEAEFAEVMP